MTSKKTKQELLIENESLRRQLAISTEWMQRQVTEDIHAIQKKNARNATRTRIQNEFEQEKILIFEQRILGYFGDLLSFSPKFTQERLLDAEIQWYIIQQFPHIDGIACVMSYQKILDALIEETIVTPFRIFIQKKKIAFSEKEKGLENDIANLINKRYSLSLGRLYQILDIFRREKNLSPNLRIFHSFLLQEKEKLLRMLTSDIFFLLFQKGVELEVFSEKRHQKKVSYKEVKVIRSLLVGNFVEKDAILSLWLDALRGISSRENSK